MIIFIIIMYGMGKLFVWHCHATLSSTGSYHPDTSVAQRSLGNDSIPLGMARGFTCVLRMIDDALRAA